MDAVKEANQENFVGLTIWTCRIVLRKRDGVSEFNDEKN